MDRQLASEASSRQAECASPPTGCSLLTDTLLRAAHERAQHLVVPQEHPGQTVDRLTTRESTDLLRQWRAAQSVAHFHLWWRGAAPGVTAGELTLLTLISSVVAPAWQQG